MADLIVRSKIKQFAEGMNVSGDLADGLDDVVKEILKKAAERSRANKRSTIQVKDL